MHNHLLTVVDFKCIENAPDTSINRMYSFSKIEVWKKNNISEIV